MGFEHAHIGFGPRTPFRSRCFCVLFFVPSKNAPNCFNAKRYALRNSRPFQTLFNNNIFVRTIYRSIYLADKTGEVMSWGVLLRAAMAKQKRQQKSKILKSLIVLNTRNFRLRSGCTFSIIIGNQSGGSLSGVC